MSTDEITALHRKLDEIHVALVGNEALGHKGLVTRVESIETKVDTHDRKLIKWGGLVVGATMAVELFKDKIIGSGS